MAAPEGLTALVRPAEGAPDGALVLLHGRGTTEQDLLPLLDVLDPHRRLAGLTPGGPLRLPPGGKHWYVVPQVGFPDPQTFTASLAALGGLVDGWLAEQGIPWERTVIGGFSQGTVMSYALGLGAGRPRPAGILALSGFIPTVPGWEPDLAGRQGLPVAIAHGRRDPVIGVEFARDASARLREAGLDVSYWESDAGHHLDPDTMPEIVDWVQARVPPRG
jgi:phospholipase/carboxylesterase